MCLNTVCLSIDKCSFIGEPMVLLFHLHHLFTSEVAKLVRRQEETDPLPFQVAMMGPEGQAKIRYIGGWAIQKSLEKSRKYAMNHKTCGTADLFKINGRAEIHKLATTG